jgi:Thermolysin metallopeptidase, catalytic domain
MCSNARRHSIFCILPPHILRTMAERGTPDQRIFASRTLAVDTTLRSLRLSAVMRPPAPAIPEPIDIASKRRTIYTAHNQQQLPGTVVASESAPPTAKADVAVREAFDGLGATWDFFFELFDRNSIDDEGMALDATVHYAIATTTPSGMAPEWCLAMATASCSTASQSPST